MINKELSQKILTLGPTYKNPKGGIAIVLNNYEKIFEKFNFITTTTIKNKIINLFTLFKALGLFLFKISNSNIKIIHIHGGSNNSFFRKRIFINLSKLFNKKIIYHIHGGEFKEFTNKNYRNVTDTLKKCDAIVALSQSWRDYFKNNLKCKNVTIIPNIINPPQLKPSIEENKNLIKFLFLGKIVQTKGIYDLLEVINKHRDYFNNKIELYIGGNGEIEFLKKYIKENNLSNIVKFEGWVDGDKKIDLLNKCDIYILPSYNEGLPISILETMSYGMPVISTKVGGIPEIVDEKNGILIQPGYKEGLFNAINYFIENKKIIGKMGESSIQKSLQFQPENVEAELEKLYISLLKDQSR